MTEKDENKEASFLEKDASGNVTKVGTHILIWFVLLPSSIQIVGSLNCEKSHEMNLLGGSGSRGAGDGGAEDSDGGGYSQPGSDV